MEYKLRAECSAVVAQFISLLHNKLSSFAMKKWKAFPYVEFEFETELTHSELLHQIDKIDDSHVMSETLNLLEDYTEERERLIKVIPHRVIFENGDSVDISSLEEFDRIVKERGIEPTYMVEYKFPINSKY